MKDLAQSFYRWYSQTLRHPKYRWIVVGGTLLYLLSPIDISPDIFPIIGWIDDGIVATLLVAELAQILQDVLKRRSGQADALGAVEVTPTVVDVEPQ